MFFFEFFWHIFMNCLRVHCLQCLMPGIQAVGQGQLVTYITCYYFCWSLAETVLHGVQFNALWCQWESLSDFSVLGCSPLLESSKKPLGFQSLKLASDLFRNSADIHSTPHRPFSVPVLRKIEVFKHLLEPTFSFLATCMVVQISEKGA